MKRLFAGKTMALQLTLSFCGIALLVSVMLALAAGLSVQRNLRQQLRMRLISIAAAEAVNLNGDLLAQLKDKQDEKTSAYRTVLRSLRDIRARHPGLRYVYTMRAHPNPKHWSFIVDAEVDPDLIAHLGEEYDVSPFPEMRHGLLMPSADYEPAWDKWGCFLSGYAPVKDHSGRTVALLGMDMTAADVIQQERSVLHYMLIVMLASLAISWFLARSLSHFFADPIRKLAKAANAVAEGQLSTQVEIQGSGELVMLTSAFNSMTASLRANRRRLIELSNTDFLTFLGNHRHFQERLSQEISRATRHHRPLSLLMFDLDHFRNVNAGYSHQGGDELLCSVAKLIKESLRDSDIPTRYGGEEFAIILPETGKAEAFEVAERIREKIEGHSFEIQASDNPLQVKLTISAGVAEFPTDTAEKEGLVLAADTAMFRAKHTSRNRVCVFSSEDERVGEHMDPVQLYRALEDASLGAVESLARALDARDAYTRGHSENVTRLALATSKIIGMTADAQMQLRIAGLLHDVGKIGIPDKVLYKQGPLDASEWDIIHSHPLVGASILSRTPSLAGIIPIVEAHHERFCGGGYPYGISGEEIPCAARIIAVADAYDAMTSDRPYRSAMTHAQALAELQDQAGRQFDPVVVSAFEKAFGELVKADACKLADNSM